MSRQGAGTSVPAPLAYPGGCAGVVCGVAGVACAVGPGLWAGLLGVLVGGGLSACCLLPRQISGRRAACPSARRPRRELRSARRLVARPRRPRVPQPGSPTCCLLPRWCSGRRMARPPARLGGLTSFVAAPRSLPVSSGPSGTLHTGAACRCVLPGQAPLPPAGTAAWSLYSLWASRGSRVLSIWGALVRVVTNVVKPRCFLCGFLSRCYKRRQSNGFFAENGGIWAWIDDVCNRGPREAI